MSGAIMARDYSPAESPLSSMDESEPYEEDGHELYETNLRPSKRQRVDAGSTTSSAVVPDAEPETVPEPDPLEGMSDVSSDTSGDIPSSPINARLDEEDFQDQVTVCDWDGCPAGDQGNMDKLVEQEGSPPCQRLCPQGTHAQPHKREALLLLLARYGAP